MISACRSSASSKDRGGGGSVKTIETKGAANLPGGIGGNRAYRFTTENLAHVPVVGLGLGSVAGLGAARLGVEPLFDHDARRRRCSSRARRW